MKKSDDGFLTPLAMTVIFSLSLMILSLSMFVAANSRKMNSYRNFILARKEAEVILSALEQDFQSLKDIPCDSSSDVVLHGILARYNEYCVAISDVSTGIHRNFMSGDFYDSKAIRNYMAMQGDTAIAEYGWIHPKLADKRLLDNIIVDFDGEIPFPIVNTFPLYNIYFMSQEFFEAILAHCGIKNAREIAEKVSGLISDEMDVKRLAEMVGVVEIHPLFDFIGTKTAFWRILFETGRCDVSAVLAAVPKKDDRRSVEKYVLIDRDISYKGGAL